MSGDFAHFLKSEIEAHSGKTIGKSSMPTINARWLVERDEFGFQVRLFDVEFAAIDAFMSELLGEPQIATPSNIDGDPQRVYGSRISGMHIQVIGRKQEIYVVAVGPKA
jgi:hypothetical protein